MTIRLWDKAVSRGLDVDKHVDQLMIRQERNVGVIVSKFLSL
jgi:hypothetical protein